MTPKARRRRLLDRPSEPLTFGSTTRSTRGSKATRSRVRCSRTASTAVPFADPRPAARDRPAGPEEPNAFVEVSEPWFDPIVAATMVELVDGSSRRPGGRRGAAR